MKHYNLTVAAMYRSLIPFQYQDIKHWFWCCMFCNL